MGPPSPPRRLSHARHFSPPALRAARESLGWSRPKAAALVGKTACAVEQFERGVTRPSAETLGLLAHAYGRSVGDFYDEDPGDPRDRYIAAVCRLLPPMTEAEIDNFAAVIRARRTTTGGPSRVGARVMPPRHDDGRLDQRADEPQPAA